MDYAKEKKELASGMYFKAHEGENKFRMVSEPLKLWKTFDQATKTSKVYMTEDEAKKDPQSKIRFAMWVINRDIGKFQIAEFGPSVMNKIFNYATSSDAGFDSIPPYDFTLFKTGELLNTEYDLIAARVNTDLTFHEQEAIKVLKSLVEWAKEDAIDAASY